MCGIAGYILKKNFVSSQGIEILSERMVNSIRHRGPDDKGFWTDKNIGVSFAFRRLAIRDTSTKGNQPMFSSDKSFVLIYNGEIYNTKELKNDLNLEGDKKPYFGTSDTEILMRCIENWGIEKTLSKLVGMFAFALWSRNEKKLFLARDRFGEKPLVYGYINSSFVFGSELKAIKCFEGFKSEVDKNSADYYFKFNTIPSNRTIYKGIQKILPGTYIEISHEDVLKLNKPKVQEYWSWKQPFENKKQYLESDYFEPEKKLKFLINRSVSDQLVSDVPLGVLLSGGIDSSLIASFASKNSSQKLKTFSVGFEENSYDETPYATRVAKILNTDHTNFILSPKKIVTQIESTKNVFDEPFSDSSQIPMKLLCDHVKSKVSVALTGDGGDEIFGGYNRHIFTNKYWKNLRKIPLPLRVFISKIFMIIPNNSKEAVFKTISNMFFKSLKLSRPDEKLNSLMNILDSKDDKDFYQNLIENKHLPKNFFKEREFGIFNVNHFREFNSMKFSSAEKIMLADLITYLSDDILVKSDRTSMSASLELRSPFLDHRIFDYVSNLPLKYKIVDAKGKVILRNILKDFLPEDLINRPKMGFSIPIRSWLRSSLKDWAENLLSTSSLKNNEFIDVGTTQKLWKDFQINNNNLNEKLIRSILMFQQWLLQR